LKEEAGCRGGAVVKRRVKLTKSRVHEVEKKKEREKKMGGEGGFL
jgi:hypothetical protein